MVVSRRKNTQKPVAHRTVAFKFADEYRASCLGFEKDQTTRLFFCLAEKNWEAQNWPDRNVCAKKRLVVSGTTSRFVIYNELKSRWD
jgi:hypothetical protein